MPQFARRRFTFVATRLLSTPPVYCSTQNHCGSADQGRRTPNNVLPANFGYGYNKCICCNINLKNSNQNTYFFSRSACTHARTHTHTHTQCIYLVHTLPIYTSTSPVLHQTQRHQCPGYTSDKYSTQSLKPQHILEPQAKRRILKTTKQDYGHMQSPSQSERQTAGSIGK